MKTLILLILINIAMIVVLCLNADEINRELNNIQPNTYVHNSNLNSFLLGNDDPPTRGYSNTVSTPIVGHFEVQ